MRPFLCANVNWMNSFKHSNPAGILLLGILVLTAALYYPSLDSGFQLDDAGNLGGLASIHDRGIWFYVLTGQAGPDGRPLSLLSFALQYSAWPGNPFAFKAVNLAIHLLCGFLIYLICTVLQRLAGIESIQNRFFALIVAALWLLHPVQLTTVLYVVQRMTQLSALFSLLGIYCYLRCCEKYFINCSNKQLLYMGASVWFFTLAATLCKENGILLPLFILVINSTLLSGNPDRITLRKWNWFWLGIPLVALFIYLLGTFDINLSSYQGRPYSMSQRLLTECIIIFDYLRSILFPIPSAFTLYHDDYQPVQGLITSPVSLMCLGSIGFLVGGSIIFRKKYTVATFSILWYFSGHVLESTYINLELFFEHRNYLPSFGIFFLMAWLLLSLRRLVPHTLLVNFVPLAFICLVVISSMMQLHLWSRPVESYLVTLENHPQSVRGLIGLGNAYIARNDLVNAGNLYKKIAERYPDEIYPYIKFMAINGCVKNRKVTGNEWADLVTRASSASGTEFGIMEEMAVIVQTVIAGECKGIDARNLIQLLVTLAFNPAFDQDRANLHEMAARLGIYIGDGKVAYNNIQAAVRYSPTISRQILNIRILLALGKEEEAAKSLSNLVDTVNKNLRYRLAYNSILGEIKNELENSKHK